MIIFVPKHLFSLQKQAEARLPVIVLVVYIVVIHRPLRFFAFVEKHDFLLPSIPVSLQPKNEQFSQFFIMDKLY
ncbi:MAG: hypothetical protein FWB86_14355 [Treponema sp.]|nr:hypothetical protein [Treponema sp.]